MAEADDLSTSSPENSSPGDFECNICFDSAQEPVITLCGHLHCWPCLYRWLRIHSLSQECPVCKALIEEEKLVPLYGRGKAPTDPRTKPVSGVEIPTRPVGQRPETALSRTGGFGLVAPPAFSDFGGVFSPVFSVQFHGFSSVGGYSGSSSSSGYLRRYVYPGSLRDQHDGGESREVRGDVQGNDERVKKILSYVLVFVLFALLTM